MSVDNVDVILLSSVFGVAKVAEPMGVCLLTACLRAKGLTVKVMEPSLDGWSIQGTVDEISSVNSTVVGLSMLRDKNVYDVLEFVKLLRHRCPERFLIVGGHGPSIAMKTLEPAGVNGKYFPRFTNQWSDSIGGCQRGETANGMTAESGRRPVSTARVPDGQARSATVVDPTHIFSSSGLVDITLSGRGAGACDVDSKTRLPEISQASEMRTCASPYFDKTPEYLSILEYIDAYMLGESDVGFPELVKQIKTEGPWRDAPGLVYLTSGGTLIFNPMPPKIANLDSLPQMARDVLVEYRSRFGKNIPASILSSRGCYYRCTFCSVVRYEKLQDGAKHRVRSNEDIVDEIQSVRDRYGITNFAFEDDNFIINSNIGRKKLHGLCDLLIRRQLNVKFSMFCRADAVGAELFQHLAEAGLAGVYLGIESVYPGDLEFFHKNISVEENYRALDTLLDMGFGLQVDAERRIMLGFITWHPLTSFGSLRRSAEFIHHYQAPPKLLRRKLRLYSGTEAIDNVIKLGLLNSEHEDGWNFRDKRIEGLDKYVSDYTMKINTVRDMIRTLEKASYRHEFEIEGMKDIRQLRMSFDEQIVGFFNEIVARAEKCEQGGRALEVRELFNDKIADHSTYLKRTNLKARLTNAYQQCGFQVNAVDLFRK
jgi:radical SAM superfamily enzyme YgiQ (UPF0313 family)